MYGDDLLSFSIASAQISHIYPIRRFFSSDTDPTGQWLCWRAQSLLIFRLFLVLNSCNFTDLQEFNFGTTSVKFL